MHVHVFESLLLEGSRVEDFTVPWGLGRLATVELFFGLLQVCETHER